MIKQLIINGKKSYDDFNVYIGARNISSPKKKVIKETPPFTNVVYDFSKINGEIYWEERKLEYSFDIAELSTEEMEVAKSNLLNWLLNVHDTDIYDPYIGDYHFHGSYDSDSWSEDFGAGTISVSFTVYPYKISNTDASVIEEIGVSDGLIEGNYSIVGLKIDGKSYQETSLQQDGDNLFDFNRWYENRDSISARYGTIVIDEKSITMSEPTQTDDYTQNTYHMNPEPTERDILLVKNLGIEVEETTKYTLSFDNETGAKCEAYIFFYDKNFAYLGFVNTINETNGRISYGLTTPAQTKYVSFRFDNEGYGSEKTTLKISNIAFKKGEYVSYSEFVPNTPSPEYPSEIKNIDTIVVNSSGKNLLNTPYTSTNKLTITATKDDEWLITDYSVFLEEGKSYTISFETDGEVRNSNGEDTVECYLLMNKGYDYIQPANRNPITITPIKSGRYYLRCDVNKNGCTHSFWNFQIEVGTVKTNFEAYKGNSKTITLNEPLRSLPNGVCDTYKNGVITRRIGVKVLEGNEGWIHQTGWANDSAFYSNGLDWKPKLVEGYFTIANLLCSHLDIYSPNTIAGMSGSGLGQGGGGLTLYISIEGITSVEDLETWLSENNVIVYYELETPTTETIEQPTITSYSPVTNVWINEDTTFEVNYNEIKTITINNNSSHRIAPTITSTGSFKIELNGTSYAIGEGTYNGKFYLEQGVNTLKLTGYGSITFSYVEELF